MREVNKEIITDSRILAIDDQAANLTLLERMLKQAGYQQFRGVTESRVALDAFHEFKPDLIALDLRMPHVDGFEFLTMVRLWQPADSFVPTLVLTADPSPKAKKDALALGAKDFLSKPLDMNEFLLRVYNLLETRWLYRSLAQQNQKLEDRVLERTRHLEEAQREILDRLAAASDLKDDETGLHPQRVGAISGLLAESIGLPKDEVDLIRRAAPLHDVGKIGVPDAILLKPGSLTPEEREQVKKHTEIGGRLLTGSQFAILQMAERIARYHHERWDGSGYNGLKEEEIPLEARIVTIADVFDVVMHSRPYKTAQGAQEAIRAIRAERGKQFDPALVDAFCELFKADALTQLGDALRSEGRHAIGSGTEEVGATLAGESR